MDISCQLQSLGKTLVYTAQGLGDSEPVWAHSRREKSLLLLQTTSGFPGCLTLGPVITLSEGTSRLGLEAYSC